MAEIMVERRGRSGRWRWLVLLAVVVLLGAAGWYFLAGPGERTLRGGDEVEVEEPVGGLPGTGTEPAGGPIEPGPGGAGGGATPPPGNIPR